MGAMVIDRSETRLCTLGQIRAFLKERGSSSSPATRGSTHTSRWCSSALTYPGGQRAGAEPSGPHHGLFAAAADPPDALVLPAGPTKRYRQPAQGFAPQ
jgi:hypothetical protein